MCHRTYQERQLKFLKWQRDTLEPILAGINAAIETVGNLEISTLEKSLPTLATVSGAAPMIGFLGTVMGMIRAFLT